MRKLVSSIMAIIVLIVLCIVLGIPFLFGIFIQKNYPALITKLNQNPNVKLDLLTYHQGWFNSKAAIRVKIYGQIPNPNNPLQLHTQLLSEFTVNQIIHHGPVINATLNNGTHKFFFGRAIVENQIDNAFMKFQAFTLWTFNNHVNTTIKSPFLKIDNEQQRVVAHDLSSTIDYAIATNRLDADINIADLQFWVRKVQGVETEISKALELNGLHFLSHTQRHKNTLWYGANTISINKLLLYPSNGSLTTVTNLQLYLAQTIINNKTNIMLTTNIEKANNQQTNLSQIDVKINLSDLDSVALGEVNQAAQNNQSMYAALFDLLTGGINMTINQFRFNTDDGPVQLQAHLQLPAQTQKTVNPLYWFKAYEKLTVQGQLQVPQPWLHKWLVNYFEQKAALEPVSTQTDQEATSTQQISYWLDNNIIKQQDNQYTLKFAVNNGNLFLNDERPKVKQYFINPEQVEKPTMLISKQKNT